MSKYLAVQYWSGRDTTTGQANPITGHYSIACAIKSFDTKTERDAWVSSGKSTQAMRGNCHMAISKRDARNLCLGMSVADFNEMLEFSAFR